MLTALSGITSGQGRKVRDNRNLIQSDPLFVNLAVAVLRRSSSHTFSQGYCINSILKFSYLSRFGGLIF